MGVLKSTKKILVLFWLFATSIRSPQDQTKRQIKSDRKTDLRTRNRTLKKQICLNSKNNTHTVSV